MYDSIALIDWLSGIMGPEELPQFSVLIDFAERHGLYPEALLRDGADPLDAWEGHYGALSVGGE